MAVIINKKFDDTELDQKITADLRTRARQELKDREIEFGPSEEGYKKTSKFGWVWALLVVFAVIAMLVIIL